MWWKVAVQFFVASIFLTNDYCAVSFGMQWAAGVIGMVVLWFVTAPSLYVSAFLLDGGLEAIWTCIIFAYGTMAMALFGMFFRFDWKAYSEVIQEREAATLQARHQKESMGDDTDVNVETGGVACEVTPLLV